jgi:hypothetical protein
MGNFSRDDTFDALKHYVGVRLQQGVPIVDADWNEMEDIRKYELRAFLKWFVGNGVPSGDDKGFRIFTIFLPNLIVTPNDFRIGSGRCLVDGWDVINDDTLRYTEQPLYQSKDLPDAWGVPPLEELKSPLPLKDRTDLVYLDVWEREINSQESEEAYEHLVHPDIGIETCVRLKREWVVRVEQGIAGDGSDWTPPEDIVLDKHVYYPLALWQRKWRSQGVPPEIVEGITVTDLRRTGLNLAVLEDEIADARGEMDSLGDRLDRSLTNAGELQLEVVNSGHLEYLEPGSSKDVLVEKDVGHSEVSRKIFVPAISIELDALNPDVWQAQLDIGDISLPYHVRITYEFVHKAQLDEEELRFDTVDLYLRITHHRNKDSESGPVGVNVDWRVYAYSFSQG